MTVLVTGGSGLVGRALAARGATALGRPALDVTDERARDEILTAHAPDAVIFCAAMTEVDRCATDPLSEAINVAAPAAWAREVPVWFVSSNFVFSGPGPHAPDAVVRPVNAYGRQKARAEEAVLAAGGHVVRTGWVYGHGGRGWASRLPALEGTWRAIDDWPVQPTWADHLADALLLLPTGITHLIGRDETTWKGFARAVSAELGRGRVEGVSLAALSLGPRPDDARLEPASLPGFREAVPQWLSRGSGTSSTPP